MGGAKRVIEWVKTALIVVLSASALVLLWRTGLLNDFFGDMLIFGNVAGFVQGGAIAGAGGVLEKEAARPLTIVITYESGERFGVKYDTESRNMIYDRTSSIFAEALGSMTELAEISELQWRAALSGAGVYYEYATPIRLSVLDGWLGTRMPDIEADALLSRVFLAFGEERNRLYFSEHESGIFFGAETASPAGRTQDIGTSGPNGARFAFETELQAAKNAPYTLIFPGNLHPTVSSGVAGNAEELLDLAINTFGHRGEPNILEYDAYGTLVCLGTEFEISVFPGGSVKYRRTDGLLGAETPPRLSAGEAIEAARVITAETIGTEDGAEVFFRSIDSGAYDLTVVVFDYYIAGGYVHLQEDGYAARVTFSGGLVTEAELNFRVFEVMDEYVELLPEAQAFAAADGDFALGYSDTGLEYMEPMWIVRT